MEIILIILLLSIIFLLTLIVWVLADIYHVLKNINTTIIDIHPNYKYKKVYESERYKQKIK